MCIWKEIVIFPQFFNLTRMYLRPFGKHYMKKSHVCILRLQLPRAASRQSQSAPTLSRGDERMR